MGIENFFPKDSYCGEILFGGSTGYPIRVNPEERVDGTIKGIVRLMQNPDMTPEDIDYCLKVNSQRLGIDQEDLIAKVKDCMGSNCEDDDSQYSDKE